MIKGSVVTLRMLTSLYSRFGSNLNKLCYNMIWMLGIINSERVEFADEFVLCDGVNIVLGLLN